MRWNFTPIRTITIKRHKISVSKDKENQSLHNLLVGAKKMVQLL